MNFKMVAMITMLGRIRCFCFDIKKCILIRIWIIHKGKLTTRKFFVIFFTCFFLFYFKNTWNNDREFYRKHFSYRLPYICKIISSKESLKRCSKWINLLIENSTRCSDDIYVICQSGVSRNALGLRRGSANK